MTSRSSRRNLIRALRTACPLARALTSACACSSSWTRWNVARERHGRMFEETRHEFSCLEQSRRFWAAVGHHEGRRGRLPIPAFQWACCDLRPAKDMATLEARPLSC
jgi:hypothetical protein